jgi:hypothetical protein
MDPTILLPCTYFHVFPDSGRLVMLISQSLLWAKGPLQDPQNTFNKFLKSEGQRLLWKSWGVGKKTYRLSFEKKEKVLTIFAYHFKRLLRSLKPNDIQPNKKPLLSDTYQRLHPFMHSFNSIILNVYVASSTALEQKWLPSIFQESYHKV